MSIRFFAALVLSLVAGCSSPDGLHPETPARRLNASVPGQLEAGAAVVDLTPTETVWVAGFGRLKASEGVRDPITARALALRVESVTAVVVAVDLIGLHNNQVEEIRSRVRSLPSGDTILVAATHSHASPDTLGFWGLPPFVSGIDDDYLDTVLSGIAQAIEDAVAALTPVTVRWGHREAAEKGISRNLRSERIDRRLTALAFDRKDGGAPLATLVHFAAHPEVLGPDNTHVSSDFPAALRATVETGRPGGVAIFINGAIGALVTTDEHNHTDAEVDRIGNTLGELALDALSDAQELPVEEIELACSRRPLHMPVSNWRYHLADFFGIFGGRPFDDGYTPSEVMVIRFGSAVLVTSPGEIEPRLGDQLLEHVELEPQLLVGLGNDELGYLIHEDEWEDERYSYEQTVSPGPLAAILVRRTAEAALRDVGAIPVPEDK
jgi:hypothetical protein